MKSITLRCLCGSAIELHDDAESLINTNGTADKQGRKFLIECRAEEWLDRHADCIKTRNQLLNKPADKQLRQVQREGV